MTMTPERTTNFNLLDEPWITVLYRDGREHDVSLLEAFRQADDIREITGEIATQSFALTRLLLAILYRALDEDLSSASWERMWNEGLPAGVVERYLTPCRERFDLLHPTRPFFQVADLHTKKGELKDVTQLIFDLPSNSRLFTNRAGDGIDRLSFAEAARWLVNAQAFDASGIKSGAVGDERVKGGKGYPLGIAWSGHLGGLVLEGASLRETLLLNLVGAGSYLEPEADRDVAPWERAEADTSSGRRDALPHGPVSLYTWQSRRIRLVSDGDGIVETLLSYGDPLTPQSMQLKEPMTAWRFSDPQSKKAGHTVYMPREHQPARALWRGISALLPRTTFVTTGKTADRFLPPTSVQWVSQLVNNERLPRDFGVQIRAIGVIYGSNNSVIDEVIDDRMLVPLAVLNSEQPQLGQCAERAVSLADEGVRALKNLAGNLEKAAGGAADAARSSAETAAYAGLDVPYRRWLAELSTATDPTHALEEWKSIARGILLALGGALLANAKPAAWAGRDVSGLGGHTELITSSRADNWFQRDIHAAFDLTTRKETA
ncbi:type I-E CRISPR-associated protein Cse1/CasA [Luethyella okanaganae]|uniref:Type I-E CRISPR-associated protein Cse1/CasA n=1 Tax=Luethyella okanaganae TaxID=69372 RepID=A0ABW1VGP6_9MICO